MKKNHLYFQLTTTATKILNGKCNNGNSKKLQNVSDIHLNSQGGMILFFDAWSIKI